MQFENSYSWFFEQPGPHGGMAGEGARNLLAGTGLSAAELIVRESIQNSADACREGEQAVRIVFRKETLRGDRLLKFLEASKLKEVVKRVPRELDMSLLGAPELHILFVEDYRTTGLVGADDDDEKPFYLFTKEVGDQSKISLGHTGGSYGYGKSVFANASPFYVIFVHTLTAEEGERTVGLASLRKHRYQEQKYQGRGFFGVTGQIGQGWTTRGEASTELSEALAFSPRIEEEYGTSVCIVGYDADVAEIKAAVEKHWWPRISDNKLSVEIIDSDGSLFPPRPKKDPILRHYLNAYDIALEKA